MERFNHPEPVEPLNPQVFQLMLLGVGLLIATILVSCGIALGLIQFLIQIDPYIVDNARNPQWICNGQVMNSGDSCIEYNARTGQPIGPADVDPNKGIGGAWNGLVIFLAQPGVNTFIYIYMGISLLVIWLWFRFRKRLSQRMDSIPISKTGSKDDLHHM